MSERVDRVINKIRWPECAAAMGGFVAGISVGDTLIPDGSDPISAHRYEFSANAIGLAGALVAGGLTYIIRTRRENT